MDFEPTQLRLSKSDFDYIVSIGNKCASRLALNRVRLTAASFPFDYVPTQPHQVLKYLKDSSSYLPETCEKEHNRDGVWFGHFDLTAEGRADLEDKFARRFERLRDAFRTGKRVLLLYTTEADIYNEMKSRDNREANYKALHLIADHIREAYPSAQVAIMAVHTDITRPDEVASGIRIYNLTIRVSDECRDQGLLGKEQRIQVHELYRSTVANLLKRVFSLAPP